MDAYTVTRFYLQGSLNINIFNWLDDLNFFFFPLQYQPSTKSWPPSTGVYPHNLIIILSSLPSLQSSPFPPLPTMTPNPF